MSALPQVCVVVPTYNRAFCLDKALDAALGQSHHRLHVVVVDDGSTDETGAVLRAYAGEPRLAAVRLAANVGTAHAKNVGLLVGGGDAVTFHDSDDLPHRDKVLVQARRLASRHRAAPILDWGSVGVEPDGPLAVDVVVHAHELVTAEGETHRCGRPLSLVDDFFPHLQVASAVEGDWVLVNSGLFRRSVFARVGGFLDSVEEDREIRNRTIAAGCVYSFVDRVLLTKVEMAASLTTDAETGYDGDTRRADRRAVWDRKNRWLRAGFGALPPEDVVEIDVPGVRVASVQNPSLLSLDAAVPASQETRAALAWAIPESASETDPSGRLADRPATPRAASSP